MPSKQLTDDDHRILTFEQAWWKYAGAKDQAIRETFEMSPTVFYQRLNLLLDDPAAHAAYPLLVKRLRNLRARRAAQRSATRLRDWS